MLCIPQPLFYGRAAWSEYSETQNHLLLNHNTHKKMNTLEKMKMLTPQEQDEIESLTYLTPPEDQGQPHDAGQAIWGELAVLRRWDWDDNGGRLSNTRHEYEVYEWDGEDEEPAFQPLTLGKLVAKFIVPTK